MAINRTPVLKRCRQLGLDPAVLGYSSKKESIRQPKRRRKESEYGMQLREKQKAKFVYGVLEKQFHGYFEKAKAMPGVTGENLMRILESRLDNVVFRLGFAAFVLAILFLLLLNQRTFWLSRAHLYPTKACRFLHGSRLISKSFRAAF